MHDGDCEWEDFLLGTFRNFSITSYRREICFLAAIEDPVCPVYSFLFREAT